MAYSNFPTTTIDEGLKTPSSPGRAPKTRLTKAEDAYSIAATLVRAAIPRVERGRMVRGLLDGNPPFPPSRLRAQAQDWRANFNTLEGRSIVSNAKTPYYDLFSSTMPLIDLELDTDDSARDAWSELAAYEFHRFFYTYASFEPNFWSMLDDFVVFNKGFFHWPHPTDPWFRRLEWWRVMFPNGTGIDPDEWNMFAVRQYFTVTKLWQLSGEGQTEGWDGRGVVGAIKRAVPLQPQSWQAQGIEIQQQLKDCDIALSARSEVVKTVSIFTREYDGRWSWCMVEEDAAMQAAYPDENRGADEQPRFLFKRDRFFGDVREIVSSFIYEAEEGSINAFTGLGKYLYQLLRAKDRIEMGLLDGVILRQYPLLQPSDSGSAQRASLLQIGPAHVLAPGVSVIATNLLADLDGSLAVVQHLDQMVESNTAIFKPRLEKPRGNPETATAASLRYQNATILGQSAVNRFYDSGDGWISEVWRRAVMDHPESSRPGIKAAREFQKCCREKGVPIDVLRKKPYELRLTRAVGNGSPVARQQALAGLTPMLPEMGPRGRRKFFQLTTSAYGGYRLVEQLWPKDDQLEAPDMNTWVAEQENNSMMTSGMEPTITDSQDNRVHIKSHLAACFAGLQAVQQGGDPVNVLTFIPVALQHTAKHLTHLPREEQKGWMQQMKQIEQAYEELSQQFQQARQQQAEQQKKGQQLAFDQQLALAKLQGEMQIKQQKNAAQMEQRQERHQQDAVLSDASTASEIQRQAAQAATDIATKKARTAADIEAQRIKTDAQAQAIKNKPKPKKA